MSTIRRLVPQPVMTLAIIGLWMVLVWSPSLGNLLLASVLGLAIPWLTRRFWSDHPRVARPLLGIMLFVKVVGDILVANWQVARLIVGPLERLRPAFLEIPLGLDDPFVATLLGSIVSLTPGTVSIEIDRDRRVLLVHALDVEDRAEMVARIKSRYEVPLKEIFRC